jgi:UMF1 family MFS transporter
VTDSAAPAEATSPPAVPDPALRRERFGWYSYDWASSVFSSTVVTVFLGPYLTDVAERAAGPDGDVHPLGIGMPPGSLFGYTLSASVFLQVFLLPLLGAIADRSGRKRELLGVLSYVGALATAALFFVQGEAYLLGAGLFIVANLAFGGSMVVYYSWLPDLASPDERDAVSSKGWAYGYLGGGLLLVLNLALFLNAESLGMSDGDAVRICLCSAGVWWALFTVVTLTRLRNHPHPIAAGTERSGVVGGSVRQLGATFRELRQRPLTLLFLVTYLLYNDGVQTVANVSAQYGSEELDLSQSTLITAILVVQFIAFGGALAMGRLAARYGTKRTILGSLVVWVVVIGIAYFLQKGSAPQFYAVALAIGFVLGGTQALSRSLFSQLIPVGKEAEYFGFYEISDRGTSWLGPFLFALTYQLTDSYRYAIFSLVFFFVVGGGLLARLDLRRAIVEAGNTPPERL